MPYSVDLLIDLITASTPDERRPMCDLDPWRLREGCPERRQGKPGKIVCRARDPRPCGASSIRRSLIETICRRLNSDDGTATLWAPYIQHFSLAKPEQIKKEKKRKKANTYSQLPACPVGLSETIKTRRSTVRGSASMPAPETRISWSVINEVHRTVLDNGLTDGQTQNVSRQNRTRPPVSRSVMRSW